MWEAYVGHTVYLDTNVIIFAIEPGNPWIRALRDLFAAIESRSVAAVTSELTLAEVLTKPLALGKTELVSEYEQVLARDGIIRVEPVSRQILRASAEFRSRYGLKLADSIHLATAKQTGCDVILTNDRELGRKARSDFEFLNLSVAI
jgi:uncharacterized protein